MPTYQFILTSTKLEDCGLNFELTLGSDLEAAEVANLWVRGSFDRVNVREQQRTVFDMDELSAAGASSSESQTIN